MFENNTHIVKQVGINGQISLGKEYAGKQIQITKLQDGTLMIKLGKFIPDNELWLYTKENITSMDKAIHWVETHERRENFDEIEASIENE